MTDVAMEQDLPSGNNHVNVGDDGTQAPPTNGEGIDDMNGDEGDFSDGAGGDEDDAEDSGKYSGMEPNPGRALKPVKSMPQEYIDNPEYIDVSKYKNKGILKRIIRSATEEIGPAQGNEVEVHYEGFLAAGDQRKFDSSKDRGQTFKFKIGQGTVIQAWDQGVATMKKGEIAELICAPEFAYGESGAGESIPPNAVLRFVVELLDVRGEDISQKKDGSVLRRTLKKGEGYQTPQDGAKVKLSVIGRRLGQEFDRREVQFHLARRPILVETTGDAESQKLPAGINICAKKLKLNEHALFTLRGAQSFTAEQLKKAEFSGDVVHAGDELEYELVLLEFEHLKSPWEYGMTEKLPEAQRMKDLGTEYFKAGSFRQARIYYDRAIKLIKDKLSGPGTGDDLKDDQYNEYDADEEHANTGSEDEGPENAPPIKNKKKSKDATAAAAEKPTDPLNIEREKVLLSLYLNMSLVYLKENDYSAAYNIAEEALELDADNVKALYRRGLASLQLADFDEAKNDFERVLELDATNADAKKQLAMVQRKRKEQHEADKSLFRNMMGSLAGSGTKGGKKPQEQQQHQQEPTSVTAGGEGEK